MTRPTDRAGTRCDSGSSEWRGLTIDSLCAAVAAVLVAAHAAAEMQGYRSATEARTQSHMRLHARPSALDG